MGRVAFAEALAIVTATAAATETGPPEVVADGVELEPEPEPPLADETLPAFERSPATWPSTPPDGAELDVPFADAVADPSVVIEPVAVKDAAPVTSRERFVVAVTVCVASVTATAAPTAAVEAAADPDAVVATDAVCVATTVSVPPTVVVPPVPSDASVVTVDSETATEGAIATPPPAAPPVEVVVIVSVLVACSVRLCALKTEPSPSAACVVSVTRLIAAEAPTPEPLTPAVASALETLVEVALKVASADGALTDPVSSADVFTFAIVSAERAGHATPRPRRPRAPRSNSPPHRSSLRRPPPRPTPCRRSTPHA